MCLHGGSQLLLHDERCISHYNTIVQTGLTTAQEVLINGELLMLPCRSA
jgi:hypothetical protein